MAIHPPFLTFSLTIARVDCIDDTIIITLQLEALILLQELGFDFDNFYWWKHPPNLYLCSHVITSQEEAA